MASGVGIQTLTATQDSWGGLAGIFMPIFGKNYFRFLFQAPLWGAFLFGRLL